MPCYDSRDHPVYGEAETLRYEMGGLESMLCGLCRRVEGSDTGARWRLIQDDPALAEWWRAHKAKDDARLVRELSDRVKRKVAKRAAAKLTPEEREALGLRDL